MDLPQNIATNISIPIIGAIVANNPSLAVAWLGISSTYLFLKAMDPRTDDFMEKVDKNIGGITEQLVKSTEFQQSLLVTFDALIRARNKEKSDIIKNVYLLGYIQADERSEFALERFYQTSQQITLEAIDYLRFIKQDIFPRKLASVEKKLKEKYRNIDYGDTEEKKQLLREEVDSNHIRAWIQDEFNYSSPIVKKNTTLYR